MSNLNFNDELVIAAENGDLETVKKCIAQGADVNFMGPNSAALHCAAFNEHDDVVLHLLENGADPNIQDNQHFYPLQLAISKDYFSISEMLVKHGAGTAVVTEKGGTLLHLAAASNFSYVFDFEGVDKIDIEAKDIYGKTALNVACAMGSYLMISYLLKRKANINTTDSNGISPFFSSLIHLDEKKITSWESTGNSDGVMVRYVISNGWMRCIKPYNGNEDELGRDLPTWEQDEIIDLSWSPEGLKEYLNAIECLEMLLTRSNLDKEHVDNYGNSAMIHACSIGEPKIIEELFRKKFPVDNHNNDGIHPLHYLARSKRLDGLKLYFEAVNDANPNVLDNNGWTPGHYLADQGGHPEMAKILIEKGLDLQLGSTKEYEIFSKGVKAYEIALHWEDEKLAGLLGHKS